MQPTHCPNEIFAKILTEFRKKASHTDMKNLKKAIEHPKLDHLEVTFDHFTSRSKPLRTEKGIFICPVCLFGQEEIYDDSMWEDLCMKIFGCHFIIHGGSETVKIKSARKRRISGSRDSKQYLQYLFSHELLMKRCKRKALEQANPFTLSFIRKIHFLKGDQNILDKLSKSQFGELEIYTDVGEFIQHLNHCQSHHTKPTIKINCDNDNQSEFAIMNYDSLYMSKLEDHPLDSMENLRKSLRQFAQDSKRLFKMISLKSPDPKLFDAGSQNHDFLQLIIWPIVTLAISIQLEDHIQFPTSQFIPYSEDRQRFLALRDLLSCICEVAESLEYDFEMNQWIKAKFAAFHGVLEILDSFFQQY